MYYRTVEVCVLIYFYIKLEMDSSVTALFLLRVSVRTLIYEHTSCVKCLINSFIGFFIFIDSIHKMFLPFLGMLSYNYCRIRLR